MSSLNKLFVDKRLPTSKAFLSLSASAIKALFIFYRKRRFEKHKGKPGKRDYVFVNNGQLVFPYNESMKYGFTRTSFLKALRDLIEKGFLDITHRGGGLEGDVSLYKLSDRWLKYDTAEFEHVNPPEPRRYNSALKIYWSEKKSLSKQTFTASSIKNVTDKDPKGHTSSNKTITASNCNNQYNFRKRK